MKRILLATIACAAALTLSACEAGYKESKQIGYRGAGLVQVTNVNNRLPDDDIPQPLTPYAPDTGGPRASSLYPGLQQLGGLSVDDFNRFMGSITQWVAPPAEGCNYCHNPENMASDEKHTFKAARSMIAMNRAINTTWASHVKTTGVTCYTCHRGNAIPEYRWTLGKPGNSSIRGNKHGQNSPDPNVGYASLPFDPFASYLQGKTSEIRVAASSAYPSTQTRAVGTKDAEGSFGLMMHISKSLNVNCVYCHNSQSFKSWNASTPQRALAYYGIRMVRDINENHITPLTPIFPADRKGPMGDPYKVNCMTCHQGKNKPLGGVQMAREYPGIMPSPTATAAAAATPEPVLTPR
jgi:photosynthetic reaction center cytochrome c subunit